MATSDGIVKAALVAGPLSPEKPKLPLPAPLKLTPHSEKLCRHDAGLATSEAAGAGIAFRKRLALFGCLAKAQLQHRF